MLTKDQAQALFVRLNDLKCVSPDVGNDLFTFVFLGERPAERERFDAHLPKCEYCQIAIELHRYQRDVGKILSEHLETGRKIIEEAKAGNASILTKMLPNGLAYFRPPERSSDLGLMVTVNSASEITAVEEKSQLDFDNIR